MSLDQDATVDIEAQDQLSMDDTMWNALDEIKSRESDSQEDSPKSSPRSRDESGKFTKSTDKSLQGDPPVSADETIPETQKVAESETLSGIVDPVAEVAPQKKPPNTWKKEAHEAFLKADPVIQSEVERREQEFHRGIDQYRQAAEWAHQIDNIITPHKETFRQLGITPEAAVSELLKADHRLRYGSPQDKAEYFSYLAKVYGVDLGHTAEVSQSLDPRIYQLQEENARLQQTFMQQQQQAQAHEYNSLHSEIDAFVNDPNHIHFDSVRGHMVALLQAGQAKDLSDAYEQAIYANPVTRASVLQQQAAAARTEAAERAQKAKAASSVNLRSRPAIETTEPVGSMEDTIRKALRQMTGDN